MAVEPATQTITIRLPSQLYEAAGRQRAFTAPPGSVRAVIDTLEASAPGLRYHLCEETGALRSFVNIFLDGVNIRNLDGLDTTVPAGATLMVFPSVAGG